MYNKDIGVFGECYCKLSFDNKSQNDNSTCKGYIPYGIVDKYSRDTYRKNPAAYENVINELNSKIDLTGTCVSYKEFRNLVGIGNYIFFIIYNLVVYDTPLQLDDFFIARWGQKGIFKPNDSFTKPRAWCYALKKDSICIEK